MRKMIVLEHISLDGVIQAPGGQEEDASGGFAYSGFVRPVLLHQQDGDKHGMIAYRYKTWLLMN